MPIDLYPNIAKVKRGGVYQNLPGFVQQSGDADIKAMIANSESSTTAQYAHPKNSFFILNDVLYQADEDIAVNGIIAVGTNCHVEILSNIVSENENDVSDLKNIITPEISITETSGYYSAGGTIQTAGSDTKEVYTNKINVHPGDVIHIHQKLEVSNYIWIAAGVYDAVGNWVERKPVAGLTASEYEGDFTVPDGIWQVSFTYRTYGVSTITIHLKTLSTYYNKNAVDDLVETIDNRIEEVSTDSNGIVKMPMVESGIVYYDNGELKYATRARAVRFKRGVGVKLKTGDIIRSNDAKKYEMLGAYTTDNGSTYNPITTFLSPYYVLNDGIYYISFQTINPNTVISDVNAFIGNFEIFRPSSRKYYGGAKSVFDKFGIKSINHRGYNTTYPENTIPAFIKSAEEGFLIVETDLRFTSDGVAVLLHDATINRTGRNADGTTISETINIEDITYEEALEYDFGIWKGAEFAGTKIPTLKEAVEVWKKLGLLAYVELQSVLSGENVSQAIDIVKSVGYEKYITWISYVYSLLASACMCDPSARLLYISESITATKLKEIQCIKTKYNDVGFDVNILNMTSENLALAKAAKESVEVWTVNTTSVLDNLDEYISGVTSDSINAQEYYKEQMLGELT